MLYNKKAVLGLPVYLLVAIIVSVTILTFLSLSMKSTITEADIHQVQREINSILVQAEQMYTFADEGTLVTIHVEFPESMSFAVFGGMPQSSLLPPTKYTLDDHTSNNYYFVMNDGTFSISHSLVRFSSENSSSIALFYPGSYDLNLELCTIGEKTYVKVY
jgi:hypothetical protein